MIEQLVALAKIADIDAEALRTETELRDIPARIEGLQGDVKKLGELLSAEKHDLADADRLLSAQDEELQNQNQALARSKSKGARAKNMREADAVERELETIRRMMKEREVERETLKEAIGKRRQSVEKHEKEFSELESYVATEKQKADVRMAELTTTRDEVLKGRAALAVKVPADVLRRYDMIRSKRQGLGAAAIKDGSCSGCFVVLTPQQVIGVARAEEFAQCPRCQRILYSREAVAKFEHPQGA
ncbi:MAG TPA: C4-type zinc ribbon domain-containing protein [Polyangiales bacterium]